MKSVFDGMWQGMMLGTAMVGLSASVVAANTIDLGVRHKDADYFGQISVSVDQATSVRMLPQGGSEWVTFTQYGSTFDFEVQSPPRSALSLTNDDIVGDYFLEITRPAGVTVYAFTVNAAQATWFPAQPVLDSVPAHISSQHEFGWAWSGAADVKIIKSVSSTETEILYWAGEPGFADLSHTVDFGSYAGPVRFSVEYGNWAPGLVSNWSLVSGEELFTPDNMIFYVSSSATVWTYVPEPASLGLLAMGGLLLVGRRRRCA